MTYTDLINVITGFLARNDAGAIAPTLIELAEARFNREVRSAKQEKRAYYTVTGEYVLIPTDFLQLRVMYIGGKRATYLTPDQFERLEDVEVQADPSYVTIMDQQFRFYPTLSDVRVEVLYFSKIEALSSSNPTNWMLTDHPDAYIYNALSEGRLYFRAQDWQAYQEKANEAMTGVLRASQAQLYGPNLFVMPA